MGDYPLYDDTCYSLELNCKAHITEWGVEIAFGAESDVMFTGGQVSKGAKVHDCVVEEGALVPEGVKIAGERAFPKIVCADSLAQADELFDPTVIAYSGKISGQTDSHNGLPVLSALSKGEELLSLVLAKAFPILPQSDPDCCSACGRNCYQLAGEILQGLAKREDCVLDGKSDLILEVGGSAVTIVPFVQKLLRDSVLAFVDNLKDIPPTGDISIKVRR